LVRRARDGFGVVAFFVVVLFSNNSCY
jgi:hypothetical protein